MKTQRGAGESQRVLSNLRVLLAKYEERLESFRNEEGELELPFDVRKKAVHFLHGCSEKALERASEALKETSERTDLIEMGFVLSKEAETLWQEGVFEDSPLDRWFTRNEVGEAELGLPPSRLGFGEDENPELGHKLWDLLDPEKVTKAWGFAPFKLGNRQQIKLMVELKQNIKLFCIDYRQACKLDELLSQLKKERYLKAAFWGRLRNYLSKVVEKRFPRPFFQDLDSWRLVNDYRVVEPPMKSTSLEKWKAYLNEAMKDLVSEAEDALNAERAGHFESLIAIEGIGEALAARLEEAGLDETAELEDLLQVPGFGPVRAMAIFWDDVEEPREREYFKPSREYGPPVGSFRLPEKETWALLGNFHDPLPVQVRRMAPEAIEAWMGNRRINSLTFGGKK